MQTFSTPWAWAIQTGTKADWVTCRWCGFIMRKLEEYSDFCPLCGYDTTPPDRDPRELSMAELHRLTT